MGSAIVGGLLRSRWISPEELAVVERSASAREDLSARFPGITVGGSVPASDAAILAVKPADAEAACRAVAAAGGPPPGSSGPLGPPRRLLSIVAGVTIERLEGWLGPGTAVLRCMPNMPAVIGAGASAVAGGASVDKEDYAWAETILSSLGVVARVPEQLLDAVTGACGSGPAYVFALAEAMISAAVSEGLDAEVSALLVTHTVLGAARLLTEAGEPPGALRARIASPQGTTVAGLAVLEEGGFHCLVERAVAAAAARSRELGRFGH